MSKYNYQDGVPESCEDCKKYVYKGDDEQYCYAARMRPFVLKKWQKKPKWCPIERHFSRLMEDQEA